jgi:hypothetical protein
VGVAGIGKAAAAVAIEAEVAAEALAGPWAGEAPGTGAVRWTAVQVHW